MIEIEIETNYIPLIKMPYDDFPEGVTKRDISPIEVRGLSPESVATAIFAFTTGVTGKVLASWIYDKLKKHKDKAYLKIDRKEVTIDEANIIRIIEEKIEIKK
jgi:hypothetical protein